MPIRYFFKQLILPPGGLLLLLLVGWWLRRRAPRLAACCFVLGFGGLWLMSLPVTVEWAGRALETEPALEQAQWSSVGMQAQAIVVLGAGREQADPGWGADQPSHIAIERLRYASRLAKASEAAGSGQRRSAFWQAAERSPAGGGSHAVGFRYHRALAGRA